MPPSQTLGERLKAAMRRKGVRNPEVAQVAGVHLKTVSKWLGDTQVPDGEALERVAQLLGVSTTWLRFGAEDAPRTTPRVLASSGIPNAVRVWLAEELLQYTKAGVPAEWVQRAREVLEAPEVHTFFRRPDDTEPSERSEAAVLKGMRAIAVGLRARLADEGYKVGANREE